MASKKSYNGPFLVGRVSGASGFVGGNVEVLFDEDSFGTIEDAKDRISEAVADDGLQLGSDGDDEVVIFAPIQRVVRGAVKVESYQ